MKRYWFLWFFILLTTATQAQEIDKFVLSGHIRWGINLSNLQYNEPSNMLQVDDGGFSFDPRLAYRVNKTWALGVSYAYTVERFDQFVSLAFQDTEYFPVKIKGEGHTAGVFVQSYIYNGPKLSIFFELDASRGWSSFALVNSDGELSTPANRYNLYTSGLHAGIRYNFYKQLGLEARLNRLANYSYNEKIFDDPEFDEYTRGVTLFNNLLGNASLGLSFSF